MGTVPQIVVVDDDHQVVRYVKKTLESNGYAVKGTTSARQALAMVEESLPDLLILDLNMPKPDGFEVLKAERSRFPGLRILVMSGHMHSSLLEAATFLGATATLQKPMSMEALVQTVRGVVGR
jgi:DNA-binding NtrC family response regulator